MPVQVLPNRVVHGAGHVLVIGWVNILRVDQDIQGELVESNNVEQHPPHLERKEVLHLAKD